MSLSASAPYTLRTSFRIVIVAELLIFVYAGYYHTVLVPGINTTQIIYWAFVFLASPLLAVRGAKLSYIAFDSRIDELKDEALDLDREERSQANFDDIY